MSLVYKQLDPPGSANRGESVLVPGPTATYR